LNSWNTVYETWSIYYSTWAHLNGVFHKSLATACMAYMCIPLTLLGSS
jgi:hypothetical protein